jgi:hypothetical protein
VCSNAHRRNPRRGENSELKQTPVPIRDRTAAVDEQGVQRERERLRLEERRVAAEEQRIQIERERLNSDERLKWLPLLTVALALTALLIPLYQLRRTLRGQAALKVLDFAAGGHDDRSIIERGKLAAAILGGELDGSFLPTLEKATPKNIHLPPEVVEHRSGLIRMLLEFPDDRESVLRYWRACFIKDISFEWFRRLSEEASATRLNASTPTAVVGPPLKPTEKT